MDERLAKAIALLHAGLNQTTTETTGDETMTPTTTTTMMDATYSRMRDGEWGLRIAGAVQPGEQVRVTTRDGRVKVETVGEIVYSNAGVTLATKAGNVRQPVPMPVQPAPVARIQPSLEQVIRDLETALAGLKAMQRAA